MTMGLTYVDIEVANAETIERWETVRCLVDSGAIYSVISRDVLEWTPRSTRWRMVPRSHAIKGIAAFRFEGKIGGADVIFGEEGDANLLGAFTLESLGLALDPLRRELRPLPMMLARQEEDESA